MKHAYYTERHDEQNGNTDCLLMSGSDNLFALEIEGNSEFILTGDYAIVDPDAEIENYDAVVVEMKGHNILARLRLVKSKEVESFFVLYPLNGAPIPFDGSVHIVGKVNSIVFSNRRRESA